MSDALSFAEAAGLYGELLPARTLLSLVGNGGEPGQPGAGGEGIPGNGHTDNGDGAHHQVGTDSQGIPGAPGSANPGS